MKTRFFYSFIFIFVVFISSAQITINRSDIGNLVGAVIIQAKDTTNLASFSPGNAGANQIWNLNGIGIEYRDTMMFYKPAGYPCSQSFSTATLVARDSNIHIYAYDDNTVLSILGMCGVFKPPDTSAVPFNPAQKRMTFPSSFNTSFSGQTKSMLKFKNTPSPPDSVKLIMTINYTALIDGWGTVNTPNGNFTCLRQKYTTFQVDSLFAYITGVGWTTLGTPERDTVIEYSWWSKTNPFIASMKTKWNGQVTEASYLLYSNIGIKENNAWENNFFVYPNPNNGRFFITINNDIMDCLDIYNVMGKRIFVSADCKGKTTANIDISEFGKGVYFVIIRKSNGEEMINKVMVY